MEAALASIADRLATAVPRVDDDFYARLAAHPWPGNVRELLNVLERLVVAGGHRVLEARDLDALWKTQAPPSLLDPPPPDLELTDEDVSERSRIAAALSGAGGNVLRAARRLGMTRAMLRSRIRRYRLEPLIPRD